MFFNIFPTPSLKDICGFHFKSFDIFLIFANVTFGSPGLFGSLTIPEDYHNFTSSFTDFGFPEPKFHIC